MFSSTVVKAATTFNWGAPNNKIGADLVSTTCPRPGRLSHSISGCSNSALTRVFLAQVANLAKFMQYGFHRGEHVRASFDHAAPQSNVGQATVRQEAGHHLEANIRKFFLKAKIKTKKHKTWVSIDCVF